MVDPFVETASIKTRNAPVSRELQDILGDPCYNVKDFGAAGNGLATDTTAIQTCFDTAFGGSLSLLGETTPHGVTDSWKNRRVFFPAGLYSIESPVFLNDVYGGVIYGSGSNVSLINHSRTQNGVVTNGLKNCFFHDWAIQPDGHQFTENVVSFDLDWDGTGTVGMGDNLFQSWGAGGDTGTAINKTVTFASSIVNCTAHGFLVGQRVAFSTTGTLPTGVVSGALASGTSYFIVATSFGANSFRISDTHGGAAKTLTGSGSGTHTATVGVGVGMRIGHSLTGIDGGHNNTFLRTGYGGGALAVLMENGLNQLFEGGASGGPTAFKVSAGASVHIHLHAFAQVEAPFAHIEIDQQFPLLYRRMSQ